MIKGDESVGNISTVRRGSRPLSLGPLAYGLKRLVADAVKAGADGFIVPDLPPEEAAEFEAIAGDLPLIRMIAPTTPPDRIRTITEGARGFLYLVSLTGITGARDKLAEGLTEFVANVRKYTSLPLCVGFGIGTPEQARAVGKIADGIIVGSACVKTIGEAANPKQAAEDFARAFKRRMTEDG